MRAAIVWGVAVVAVGLTAAGCDGSQARAQSTDSTGRGVAVVELFTSEGCSSCPPADAVLRRITQSAREHGRAIYTLAFHVDYWNRLGWADPFSDPAHSERQRQYAEALDSRVYTPQAVVNGRYETVGSREKELRSCVKRALDRDATAHVELKLAGCEDHLEVQHAVRGATEGTELTLALVERGLSSKVTRGENRGRTLRHANVVRALRTVSTDETQTGLDVSDVRRTSKASVVGFVQHGESRRVRGASRVDLSRCPD